MGVSVYLLDSQRRQRAAIGHDVSQLIHSEADGRLEAEIAIGHQPRSGEYLAFVCRDGRGRLFEVQQPEEIDSEGIDAIDALDAAWAELKTTVVPKAAVANKTAQAAMEALLAGTGWQLATVTGKGEVGNIAEVDYETAADAMERIADTAKVRLVPYYQLTGGRVTAKLIDLLPDKPTYRGRIISAKTARDIVLTEQAPPMGRVYAVGGWDGKGSERQRVTLERVAWSQAAGDPVDKAAGVAYIDLPEWTGAYRRSYVFTSPNEADPMQLAQDAWEDLQERSQSKLTGTANAGDISFADGYSHAQVYPEDLVGVRSRSGRAVQTRVANVRWDYVFPELTVLEFGERQSANWIQTQIAQQQAETGESIRRLRGGMSNVSAVVEDNGVELYRAIEQLVDLEDSTRTEFNEVWIDLDAAWTEIELKAQQTTVDELGTKISSAEIRLNGAEAAIKMRVEKDGVVAAINLSTEGLVIDASKVDLGNYATVGKVESLIANSLAANINSLQVGTLSGTTVSATYLKGSSFTFGDKLIQRKSMTVSTPSGSSTIYYLGYTG